MPPDQSTPDRQDGTPAANRPAEGASVTGVPATGVPAMGQVDGGALEPLGQSGMHHWRISQLSRPGLEDRDNVFFAAVEMTRMPMVLADPRQPDTPIVFANNAFLDLTGYEESEIVGRNCRFLQGAQTDPAAVARLRQAIVDRQPIALELLNYRRDGSPFWNAIFMGPVYDTAGEVMFFFASQLDVSRRRDSEEQFRQAQKMEAIGQLTAGLAHDFNNLIHIITSSLERIGVKREDPRALERYLASATAAAQRGAKLTQQLLAFARRTRLEPVGADLSALVNGIADLLESAVGKSARLHLHLQRRLPPVTVDPAHLEMALLNIVVNARDASENGGAITVATREVHSDATDQAQAGDFIELSVSDTGAGMPEHIRLRAVEPFFTTKPKGSGTGLGLAMAHGFAQQSGGRLEIDSAPGEGTTVRLLFPVGGADDVFAKAPQTTGYVAQAVDPARAPPTILVVEDDGDIAALAKEALEETGYRVTLAESADQALRLFQADADKDEAERFALVFTDVVMPGSMNGVALAQKIRALAPTVPVLLTTGYNDQMALDGPQAHAMDVLGKPYGRSELLERVQAALRSGARTGELRRTSDFGVATA